MFLLNQPHDWGLAELFQNQGLSLPLRLIMSLTSRTWWVWDLSTVSTTCLSFVRSLISLRFLDSYIPTVLASFRISKRLGLHPMSCILSFKGKIYLTYRVAPLQDIIGLALISRVCYPWPFLSKKFRPSNFKLSLLWFMLLTFFLILDRCPIQLEHD